MTKRDLSNFDASHRAGADLDIVLRSAAPVKSKQKMLSVEEALRQKRFAGTGGTRSALRVLFISQDATLLNQSTQSLDGYLNLSDLFEEVHILILRTGIPAKYPTLRVEENVWLHTASAKTWWQLPTAGVDLIEKELVFAQGFRPDLIVARDPFESGLVGKRLAESYDKPLQIHVLKNYTGDKFKHEAAKNFWRRFLPRYTIPSATSVRADTRDILELIKKRFSISDSTLLPKFQSYDAIAAAGPEFQLSEKYKPFIFFFLCISDMRVGGQAYKALDAAKNALQNRRLALIVLGDGPAKSELQKRAKLLGIEEQVIFESKISDIISYLKGSHVLLAPDEDTFTDEVILKAAAAGLPAIMATTETREDYFENGVSGLLFDGTNEQLYVQGVNHLLNNAGQRQMMGTYAQKMVQERFHGSAEVYRDEYRNSIEETILVHGQPDAEQES